MNLSTARSSDRAREVGMRKVFGGMKNNLVMQFLTESVFMSLLSFLLAIGIVLLALPSFNHLADKNINGVLLLHPFILVGVLLLMIVVGLIAGSYPAFVLSSFQPIEVLKGKLSRGFKGSAIRNVLVVFKFSISLVLVIGTVIIFNQLNYIRHQAISTLKTISYTTPLGTFNYRTLKPAYYFGYIVDIREGLPVLIAEIEKALLDYLYLDASVKTVEDLLALRLNIPELIDILNWEKLYKYAAVFNSVVLNKRIKLLKKIILNAPIATN